MYKKISKSWMKHLDFIILDSICLQLSFAIAYWIRHGWGNFYRLPVYRNMAIYLALINLVVVFFHESYRGILRRGYLKELKAVVSHICYLLLLSSLYLFVLQDGQDFSRIVFMITWGICVILMYIERCLWKNLILSGKISQPKRSLVIVTTSHLAEACLASLQANGYIPYLITGICLVDKDMVGEKIMEIPVVSDEKNVLDYIKYNWVDEVLFNLPKEKALSDELISGCAAMGVTIHLILTKMSAIDGQQMVEKMGNYTVLSTSINIATDRQLFLKRALDVTGGIVGTLITGLLTIIIGPIIYIQSPGPIFFAQERVGKNGKKFKMYKFRSMYMDAEERKKELMAQNDRNDDLMFKMEHDPRIIGAKDGKKGIGHFIRETSLDEFPQFINVLKGEMSLVGTRPPTFDEWEKYSLHHRARLAIKPGVTGMWQVSGRSNILDFEDVVALDTKYIRNWSLSLDIKILFQTIKVVLFREGSA